MKPWTTISGEEATANVKRERLIDDLMVTDKLLVLLLEV